MCLITFAWNAHPKYKLILAANRDEFYDRPTAPLGYWPDHPGLLGGRDLKEGGTWMGMTTKGRFTAITNYRDLSTIKTEAPSRGKLTLDFLKGPSSPGSYFESVRDKLELFNGFNLLTLEGHSLCYFNNVENTFLELPAGLYGLSNSFLDTPWPKVERAKAYLRRHLANDKTEVEEIFDWLGNTELAPDEDLPETGVGRELEKRLSAMCIETENYGTCCSTVVTISHSGEVGYTEKTYARGGRKAGIVNIRFSL